MLRKVLTVWFLLTNEPRIVAKDFVTNLYTAAVGVVSAAGRQR